MEPTQKAVAVIEEDAEKDFGEWGGFTAVLSTPSLDRDGDRLHREEWIEPFEDRYPLDIDHGMSVEDTIGSFRPYFNGDALMMDAYFASTDKAQIVRRLIDEGHIRSVSVAFLTDKSKKDNEPRRELLNAGVVAIPANRDAVILACKNAGIEMCAETDQSDTEVHTKDTTEEEPLGHWCMSAECGCSDGGSEDPADSVALASIAGAEIESKAPSGTGDGAALTQAIHDASVHLGAICYPIVSESEDPTGSSDGANKSVEEEITFTTSRGQEIAFPTREEAKQFFISMIASLDENPELVGVVQMEKSPDIDLEAIKPEGMTQEQFESALKKLLTPESPEEPAPVEETAAASTADWAMKTQLMKMRLRTRNY